MENTLLSELGFDRKDKVIIFHVDDVGMFECVFDSYMELKEFGIVTSGSLMTPCLWTNKIFENITKEKSYDLDLGVHITLTNEWNNYSWGPVSTPKRVRKKFPKEFYSLELNSSDLISIEREIDEQIKTASSYIDITHIDTHMLSAWHPQVVEPYVRSAIKNHTIALLVKNDFLDFFSTHTNRHVYNAFISQKFFREMNVPCNSYVDNFYHMPLETVKGDRVDYILNILDRLPPGLTHFTIHPAKKTKEVTAIATDWAARVSDYTAFKSEKLKDAIARRGIKTIGYKEINKLLTNKEKQ